MKNKIVISAGIFLVIILLIITIQAIQAQEQKGCCLDTGKGQQCVSTTRAECLGRFFTGPPFDCSNVAECKAQTCIPKQKDEACMRNKAAAECLAMGGVPDAKPLEEIAQCKPGCCIIAKGVKAEVLQYRQCENLTKTLGYDLEMMEFKEGITSQIECKKVGSPSDLGCCVVGDGDCKYGAREQCGEGSFVPLAGGLFCRDVTSCALTTHFYSDCGTLPGTETDIYFFDSQGNQEELKASCRYPEAICSKDAEGRVSCKDTKCDVNGQAQEMSSTPPKITIVSIEQTLLTGTSMCYNFYTDYVGGEEKDEAQSYLYRRSTGLQNQIIHCGFGKLEIEGLGVDRQKLCFPANPTVQGGVATFHANVKENKGQNCSQCGASSGLFGFGNDVGDFLGPASIGLPTGKMFSALFGDYCTKEKCENIGGDCYYHQDLPGFVGGTPVGSCDSIYPPGSSASKCSECGDGGDSVWNLCTRAECNSKGDCTFNDANAFAKAGTLAWFWPGLAVGERVSSIIPECTATSIYCAINCAAGCTDTACLHPSNNNFFKCLGDRGKAYAIWAPVWIINGKLIGAAWDALSGKVTTAIVDKATSSVIGGEKK